ncbi:trans-aconitate 2-methyltransferase [Actinokineospora fastidiosa]|uniref:Trans-aconitate 2-methyltransferase n=1 Tax=Actinokineospora fastidiosa TaxID=1816 RepID=A0A918GJP6_9PSEU|nr:trans-aconitate 2-methyltransferase [Actinokineospora fastidiosa]GGS41259.1 trans-aconitate 2-methyltransferase [Actinokineospora fastidiosa]
MWNPADYLAFGDQRGRPFYDLVARVAAAHPRSVVDLGCGPGTLTATLSHRWPGARIAGIDSSPEMVAAAKARGVDVREGDLRTWEPAADTDVVISNAALQWVPDHADLLRAWASALPSHAWIAVQVPGNFAAPSHVLTRELAADPIWRDRIGPLRDEDAVLTPAEYADLFTGCEVDAWETTYLHCLDGEDPVLEWITGTALRPVRAALDDAEWEQFRATLAPLLRAEYPPRPDGTTWFPFRRVFVVARTP